MKRSKENRKDGKLVKSYLNRRFMETASALYSRTPVSTQTPGVFPPYLQLWADLLQTRCLHQTAGRGRLMSQTLTNRPTSGSFFRLEDVWDESLFWVKGCSTHLRRYLHDGNRTKPEHGDTELRGSPAESLGSLKLNFLIADLKMTSFWSLSWWHFFLVKAAGMNKSW